MILNIQYFLDILDIQVILDIINSRYSEYPQITMYPEYYLNIFVYITSEIEESQSETKMVKYEDQYYAKPCVIQGK